MAHLITEPSFESNPDPVRREGVSEPFITVAVDLVPVRPGGANGGHKIFTLELLRRLQNRTDLHFVFLTASDSHPEIRALASADDLLICVHDIEGFPFATDLLCPSPEYHLPAATEELCRQIGADVLYAPFGDSRFAVSGLPYVTMVADLLHRDYPMSLSPAEIAHREDYLQRSLRQASMVQCVSHYTHDRLRFHYEIPIEKLFVTYEPLHERLGQRQDLSRTTDRRHPFFFYPANYWVHKNHEVLLLAYALYLKEAGSAAWDLVFSGHPDDRSRKLETLAGNLGICDRVEFSGFVEQDRMDALWQQAGALVFPSLHEGFGIPLVEAMHHGLPIVTSGEGSISEIVGDAALITDCRRPHALADALTGISGDADLRNQLARKGRERLVLFDFASETRRLGDVLKRTSHSFAALPTKPASEGIRLSTPASPHPWRFELTLRTKLEGGLFRLALGRLPWGYLDADDFADLRFSFLAVPDGRTLELEWRPGGEDADSTAAARPFPLESISCRSAEGTNLLLRRFRD